MVVGLTGGIGSGKTTVAKLFSKFNDVAIYIADIEAKKLMNSSEIIKKKLIKQFGESSFVNQKLNRNYISEIVFNDKEKLSILNAIVHPEVAKDFKVFLQTQNAPYVIYESALLFETDGKKYCDEVVLVTAPTAVKIERIQKRDQASEDEILARMNNQMTDCEKIPLADHVLENTTLESLQKQVMSLHQLFVKAP